MCIRYILLPHYQYIRWSSLNYVPIKKGSKCSILTHVCVHICSWVCVCRGDKFPKHCIHFRMCLQSSTIPAAGNSNSTSVSLIMPLYGNFIITLKAKPSSTPLLMTVMLKGMLNLSLRYTGVVLVFTRVRHVIDM